MKKLFTLIALLAMAVSWAWADELRATVFSLTDPTAPTENLESQASSELTATISGGSALVYNGKGSAAQLVTNSQVNLGGSSASYLKITLDYALAEGDVITLKDYNGNNITTADAFIVSTSTTKGSTNYTFPYEVNSSSALKGKKEIYFWKSAANTIRTINIESSNIPVKMTYVDYDNKDKAFGEVKTAYFGYNNNSNGTIGFAKTEWGVNKVTFIQVDASTLPANATITGATLTANYICTDRTHTLCVGYNDSEWSSSLTYNTANLSGVTQLDSKSASKNNNAVQYSHNILGAFTNDADNIVTLLLYDSAAGGSTISNPTVRISYTTATIADYTINYKFEGNTIKTVNGNTVVGDIVNAESPITINEQKYYAVNGANLSMTIDAAAANNVLNVNLRKANVYSYSVSNSFGETLLSGDNALEGEQIFVDYPRFVYNSSEKILYKANAGTGTRKYTFYQTANSDINETISYAKNAWGIVYFSEAENVAGAKVYNSCNGTYNYSSGSLAVFENYTYLTTLPAGKYKLYVREFGRTDRYFHFAKDAEGSNTIWANVGFSGFSADMNEHVSNEIILDAETPVYFKGGYGTTSNNGQVVDLFYIQRLDVDTTPGADATVAIVNPNFEASTWNQGWNGTGNTKKNAFAKQSGNASFSGNFAEMWDASSLNAGDLNQTLYSLPAGVYDLSAKIVANASAVLYATVGSTTYGEEFTCDAATVKTTRFVVEETGNVTIGFKHSGRSAKTWQAIDDFSLTYVAPASIPVTISAAGYATFVTPCAMDFSESAIEAYTVSSIKDGYVTLEQQTEVPAGEAIIVKGATANVPAIASAAEVTNELTYSNSPIEYSDEAAVTYYILAKQNENVVFAPVNAGTIAAGKGYFTVAKQGQQMKAFQVVFDGENATDAGVVEATPVAVKNGKYTENGQIVIFINGKKYNVAGMNK